VPGCRVPGCFPPEPLGGSTLKPTIVAAAVGFSLLNFVGFLKLACEQMVIERIQLDLGLRLILTNTHHYGSPAMGNCLKAVTGNEQILVFWSSPPDPQLPLGYDFKLT